MLLAFLLALPCAPCHPQQVAGFARSGMAQSMGRPLNHPAGRFTHAGARFTITNAAGGMRHRIERPGHRAEYPVEFFIGSGRLGRSYVVRIGDALFQSPASYYSQRRAWDLSPGYERDATPDFYRRIGDECLFCHSGRESTEAIACDRCHGAAEAHLAKPAASNIVNPRKLSARARDSVCEQCHLSGEARVPNPGRSFRDFAAGRNLEEVFSVYVGGGGLRVTSHAEQLAQSACARSSGGKLWCGSCHDPHEPQTNYRARCLSCHQPHPAASDDCAACHMPRRPSSDIAHTSVTDHRILRQPAAPASQRPGELTAWRKPPRAFAKRNLGLACISVGERDQSAGLLNEGFRLLSEVPAPDPPVLTALGLVLLRKNATAEAIRLLEEAVRLEPNQARHHLNLATALRQAGQTDKARESLERARALDPHLPIP